ncbi:hypothetical protein GCM10009535_53660 [Streptomyces thermocarboxydovorans]|uniref:Uncharacterized protein n=1 Tax=Streptomyces thermocarboxydovorans TaxID=59298 RepID=A0ABP3T3M1_9ACTN
MTARPAVSSEMPVPMRLPLVTLMGFRVPSVWGELPVSDRPSDKPVPIDAREARRDKVENWPTYRW